MKKTAYYPTLWHTYPFSLDLMAHWEKEVSNKEAKKHMKRRKFKLALGW